MDQNTLRELVKVGWGALFVVLGIAAVLCFLLILRSRVFRSRGLREPKEVAERAAWRERVRAVFRRCRPPRE
jgi:hypothetical protein